MKMSILIKKSALIIIFLSVSAASYAQNPTAVIKEITGTVEIKAGDSANWISAKIGDVIRKDTILSTGFKSSAILSVGSSTLTVRPLTRLSLAELLSQNDTETININLNTGRIRAEVSPPSGGRANFTVQSPSATASVRGTEFEMDTVSIQVISGVVSYAPTAQGMGQHGRSVTVSAGQESWVDTDTGSAVTPMAASDTARTVPSLPGQEAGTISDGVTKKDTTGSLSVDIQLGGQVEIEIIHLPNN